MEQDCIRRKKWFGNKNIWHESFYGMKARNSIMNDNPKMAIAVYHNPQDFHKIFNFIIHLRFGYDVYLRHYTEGWSETIMYFILKHNK